MMSAYITEDDVADDALKGIVTDEDFIYASGKLDSLVVERLGLTVADIMIPLHTDIKEYVLAHAYARRSKLTIGMGNRVMDGMDVYAYKYNLYIREAAALELRITPSMVTGIVSTGTGSKSIPLYRG